MEGYFKTVIKKKDVVDTITKLSEKRKAGDLDLEEYYLELNDLCKRHNLREHPWREVFEKLVYGGLDAKLDFSSPIYDVCHLRPHIFEDTASPEDIDWLNKTYPLSISMSPYASIDDVIDYIRKNKPTIQSILQSAQEEKIENKIKKYKARDPKKIERDELVYELKRSGDLSNKEIARFVSDKYGISFTYKDVQTSFTREKKRRQ